MAKPARQLFAQVRRYPAAVPLRGPLIVGVDLSVRGLGIVAAPLDYGLDFRRVQALVVGWSIAKSAPENRVARRILALVTTALEVTNGEKVTEAVFEQYAFRQGLAHARAVAEVGGHLKAELAKQGAWIVGIPASSARKFLLGKNPTTPKGQKRSDPKDYVRFLLQGLEEPPAFLEEPDACDAWAVLNCRQGEIGRAALCIAA